jgi:hypothetical protein
MYQHSHLQLLKGDLKIQKLFYKQKNIRQLGNNNR